jgi:hypothetical protein
MTEFQFFGAQLKMDAANGHYQRLHAVLEAYSRANADSITHEEVGEFREISCDLPPLPHEASIIAGEAAYQLRSALDVMTCHLARLSGAADTGKTYFPMASDKAYFESKPTQRKIQALSPERQQRIRDLKPYEDEALKNLNALANFDRHDDLLAAMPSVENTEWSLFGEDDGGPLRVDAHFRQPAPHETGKITFMRIPLDTPAVGGHFKVHLKFVFTHAPLVGAPVMDTLALAGQRVRAIIQQLEAAENA